jgi:hypothetical protein
MRPSYAENPNTSTGPIQSPKFPFFGTFLAHLWSSYGSPCPLSAVELDQIARRFGLDASTAAVMRLGRGGTLALYDGREFERLILQREVNR